MTRRSRAGAAQGMACAVAAGMLLFSAAAFAQGRGGRRTRPPPPPQDEPKSGADQDETPSSPLRTEPTIAPPADPLAMTPETRERIGTDWDGRPPAPEGPLRHPRWFPYYEETRGDYRLRLLPPLFVEQTRGLRDPTQALYGVPKTPDTEGLYGLLYYRRRSLKIDMDVVFPAVWSVRNEDSHTLVLGPIVHREAPGEHDNWVAPAFFEGERKHGGYFHCPLLLTTSHWGAEGAFTMVGPYFRDRSGTDVDWGVAPLLFHGDNGNVDGNRRTYTLVPPLLYYHSEHELDASSTTVVGPVVTRSDAKRDIFDVAPLYFHIRGKPQSGGVAEEHTTLFPLFHYGHDPDKSLFVLPGYYRRVTRTTDTMITPLFSHAETRSGATSLTVVGPVVPLWFDYRDRDLDVHAWAAAPFFYTSDSPSGHDWLTPLVGRFETYGASRTWWFFPSLTLSSDTHGWESDLHPIVYVGRDGDSTHAVVAPVFWDFANPKGRTTIGFPVYWRFADGQDDSVVQVAANTLYMQKRVAGGHDWQFHLLPLFSYGENPNGYFWNVLFGMAGYTRDGRSGQVRALWIPFDVGAPAAATRTATAR
ncbi:MAG TPA: hypothetical protein VKU41_18650 [Polyangiaceae bacterium]|nr:hypothetical protein [Polyangiaceae bacterium]